MSTNGHFASIGDRSNKAASYEHGVQVVDEEKDFKYTLPPLLPTGMLINTRTVQAYLNT